MGQSTFTFVTDPGHGWLLVKESELSILGLTTRSFSEYSYRSRDGVLALEEDCDASIFKDAWELAQGNAMKLTVRHSDLDCIVRGWPRIKSGIV